MSTATHPGISDGHGKSAKILVWTSLVLLPVGAAIPFSNQPRWLRMWSFAFAIYAACKWLTLVSNRCCSTCDMTRSLGYLFLWPGMNAGAFLGNTAVAAPRKLEWFHAGFNMALGIILLGLAVSLTDFHGIAAAWIGMTGIVFVLHFGLFRLLSLIWRATGVDAPPIMNCPICSASVSEFWGRRWNLAFRDLAHSYVFRPLVDRCGVTSAAVATFLVSGLIHDAVISIPAGAGFGLPTAYFAIQGAGVLLERSRVGRYLRLGRGVAGWLFCAVVIVAPVCLLFHPAFIERVMIPMLTAMKDI